MREDRLLKLAGHLESGQLGHDKFSFSCYSKGERKPNACGTVGCALGECPYVWPDYWMFRSRVWNADYAPILKADLNPRVSSYFGGPLNSAASFFEITCMEATQLFVPDKPHPALWNKTLVLDDASREEVAKSIRNFVAWKKEGNWVPNDDEAPEEIIGAQMLAEVSL